MAFLFCFLPALALITAFNIRGRFFKQAILFAILGFVAVAASVIYDLICTGAFCGLSAVFIGGPIIVISTVISIVLASFRKN